MLKTGQRAAKRRTSHIFQPLVLGLVDRLRRPLRPPVISSFELLTIMLLGMAHVGYQPLENKLL
jgi:hypothetical protein